MTTVTLFDWNARAIRLIREYGFRGMSESAAIKIIGDARISPALLTLTYLEIIEAAGHGMDRPALRKAA